MDKELKIKESIKYLDDTIENFQKEIDKFQKAIDIQKDIKKEYIKKLKEIENN